MFKRWQKDFLRSRELERRLTGLSQQRAAETLHHVVQSWHHVTMETNAVKQHHSVVQSQVLRHLQSLARIFWFHKFERMKETNLRTSMSPNVLFE